MASVEQIVTTAKNRGERPSLLSFPSLSLGKDKSIVPFKDAERYDYHSSVKLGWCYGGHALSMGSSGLAVGANQGLPHQDSTNEFSPFFDHVGQESLFAHGFLMLQNEAGEHTFSTATPKEPINAVFRRSSANEPPT
jgi:hypothetical protein